MKAGIVNIPLDEAMSRNDPVMVFMPVRVRFTFPPLPLVACTPERVSFVRRSSDHVYQYARVIASSSTLSELRITVTEMVVVLQLSGRVC